MGKMVLNGKEYAGSGSEWHEYSTDEKIVGKWIDGKPLYEKTFVYDNVSKIESRQTYIAGLTNIKRLIRLEGTIHENSFFCVPYSNGAVSFGIIINANGDFETKGNDSWLNSDLTIVVRYTKTTD